jgi:hypothetical protein
MTKTAQHYCRLPNLFKVLLIVAIMGFSSKKVSQKFGLPSSGEHFTTDNLGNLFVIRKDNSIEKYDLNGQLNAKVNFKLQGNLTQFDASNPFELYAFYRDQQVLMVLDNLLSLITQMNFSDLSTGEISAACRSFDNGAWFFDSGEMKLKKMDKNGTVQLESLPFGTWTKKDWYPTRILDNDKYIFVYDPINGLALFDVFANYYKTVDLNQALDFQVKNNQIVYFNSPFLKSFNFKLLKTDTLYSSPRAKLVRNETNLFFIQTADSIVVKRYQ